jgi:hypothetical protein
MASMQLGMIADHVSLTEGTAERLLKRKGEIGSRLCCCCFSFHKNSLSDKIELYKDNWR